MAALCVLPAVAADDVAGAGGDQQVTVYYTEGAGHKVVHFFKGTD
jgi:hypothetical protein